MIMFPVCHMDVLLSEREASILSHFIKTSRQTLNFLPRSAKDNSGSSARLILGGGACLKLPEIS